MLRQDFSSILSSIGRKPQPPQHALARQASNSTPSTLSKASTHSDAKTSAPKQASAGVKRKSEELEVDGSSKVARLEESKPHKDAAAAVTSSRFQLSTKPVGAQQLSRGSVRSTSNHVLPSDLKRAAPKPAVPPSGAVPKANGPAPVKRSFASIMEKAKAAEEAARAAGSSTIKHKAAEKLTKRDRRRKMEEAKAEQKAHKREGLPHEGHGKNGRSQPRSPNEEEELSVKVPVRKGPQPLSYKGTMRPGGASDASNKKRKGQPEGKYGGYVSWSDMDDAEDEEDDYESEGSSAMEGGFDDLEREELMSARTARKEDQQHLEEEERHRLEKLERKRKLTELSQAAKAKKRY